jgi:hypothetical protein
MIVEILEHIRAAGREGGVWLALVVAIAALGLAALAAFNPTREVYEEGVRPVAQWAGVLGRTCPEGWTNTSETTIDARIISCERDGWLVVLDNEQQFDQNGNPLPLERGVELDNPEAEWVPASEVPGWPGS